MKKRVQIIYSLASTIVFLLMLSFSANAEDEILIKKSLRRWVDPVFVDCKLAGSLIGKPISNLRLYAYTNGRFEPIRYQIDEMTQDGDRIFPSGDITNTDLANGKLDPWDKLVFMIGDLGDRVSSKTWPAGYTVGEELEVVDPINGEKGWCYLLFFDSTPPVQTSLPDYVQFDYDKNVVITPYYHAYNITTKDGKRTTYYKEFIIPREAGGNGVNAVDRLKIRPTVKLLFGSVTLKFNEELIKCNVLAYKSAPIMVTRRLEQYAHAPGGIKIMRVIIDVICTRDMATVPLLIQIPFRLDRVLSSCTISIGTDYNENAFGARVYNSNNPQGFLVDGKMDEHEKNNFNPEFDNWRLLTGECGTFMCRTIIPPDVRKYIDVKMHYIDDITRNDPPESSPGTVGYIYQEWNIGAVPRGKYYLFVDFPWIPNYKKGDEMNYVNYRDHLVKIRSGNQEGINQATLIPNVGKRYRGKWSD